MISRKLIDLPGARRAKIEFVLASTLRTQFLKDRPWLKIELRSDRDKNTRNTTVWNTADNNQITL